jgi:hypothetical protein
VDDLTIFFINDLEIFLPNKGIAFLLIANASNGPSHNTKGEFQITNISNGIMSLETLGFNFLF